MKAILEPFAPGQIVRAGTATEFSLDVPPWERYPAGLFFGATRIGKRYIAYHLMPAYLFPDLLEGISEPLRERPRGKSRFDFPDFDPATRDELARLTAAGYARYRETHLLGVAEAAHPHA